MKKLTYYLSVGYLRSNHDLGAKAHLTVLSKMGEYRLSPHERALWNVLSHKPLTDEEMRTEYKNLLDELGMSEDVSFDECLSCLCERELIISGNGEYEIEALYDMMQDILILPPPGRDTRRTQASFLLPLHKPALHSLRPKRRLSQQECEVLALVQKTPLTTAQLVMAVECKSWSSETLKSVTDSIDRYRGKAMKVYAEMMYSSPRLESVLDAVFALRQEGRIICMK